MNGQQLGRLVLVADSAYCALAAVALLVFAGPLSGALDVPVIGVVVIAALTAGWALGLRLMARQGSLRPWLVRVLVANILAVGLIGALVLARSPDLLSVLLAAVAFEVAGFAVIQAIALRRPA